MLISEEWLEENTHGVIIRLLVQPNASRTEVCGVHDRRLKVKVQAPPVDGAANKALKKFLSKKLRVSKSAVQLISGTKSRQKSFLVKNVSALQLEKLVTVQRQ